VIGPRPAVFSLYPEIRALAWIGAMLAAAGAGLILKDHAAPVTITILILAAAALCYAWAWLRRDRDSLVDDSVLLLGGMLLSAAGGYVESQWHPLGVRMLLLLAVLHAIGAYVYDARTLLSLSISALGGWLGVDRDLFFSTTGVRLLECALLVAAWREADRRLRTKTTFTPVFDHTAFTLAFWGAIALDGDAQRVTLTLLLAAAAVVYGFRTRAEAFVLYGFIYAAIAIVVSVGGPASAFFVCVAAVAALAFVHWQFRRMTA
jgi:hypothetical protein